jgi:hypothetical protein
VVLDERAVALPLVPALLGAQAAVVVPAARRAVAPELAVGVGAALAPDLEQIRWRAALQGGAGRAVDGRCGEDEGSGEALEHRHEYRR